MHNKIWSLIVINFSIYFRTTNSTFCTTCCVTGMQKVKNTEINYMKFDLWRLKCPSYLVKANIKCHNESYLDISGKAYLDCLRQVSKFESDQIMGHDEFYLCLNCGACFPDSRSIIIRTNDSDYDLYNECDFGRIQEIDYSLTTEEQLWYKSLKHMDTIFEPLFEKFDLSEEAIIAALKSSREYFVNSEEDPNEIEKFEKQLHGKLTNEDLLDGVMENLFSLQGITMKLGSLPIGNKIREQEFKIPNICRSETETENNSDTSKSDDESVEIAKLHDENPYYINNIDYHMKPLNISSESLSRSTPSNEDENLELSSVSDGFCSSAEFSGSEDSFGNMTFPVSGEDKLDLRLASLMKTKLSNKKGETNSFMPFTNLKKLKVRKSRKRI